MGKIAVLMICLTGFTYACAFPQSISGAESLVAKQKLAAAMFSPAVQKIIREYADECKAIGGKMIGETQPKMLVADLDGDGKPDFIFNPENLQCSESASLFCSNGGCEIRIAVSSNGYRNPVVVLGGEPKIQSGPQGKAVKVLVQSFNCNGAMRRDTCISTYSWKHGKMAQRLDIQR